MTEHWAGPPSGFPTPDKAAADKTAEVAADKSAEAAVDTPADAADKPVEAAVDTPADAAEKPAEKKGFTFGGKAPAFGAAKATSPKKGFTFGGKSPEPAKKGFTFGGKAPEPAAKGGFTFGGQKPATTGGFKFGSKEGNSTVKSAFDKRKEEKEAAKNAPPSDEWECACCTTKNADSAKVCSVCLTKRIMPKKKAAAEWECACCSTKNASSAKTCSVCMVKRPAGAVPMEDEDDAPKLHTKEEWKKLDQTGRYDLFVAALPRSQRTRRKIADAENFWNGMDPDLDPEANWEKQFNFINKLLSRTEKENADWLNQMLELQIETLGNEVFDREAKKRKRREEEEEEQRSAKRSKPNKKK